ncbi:MAG: MucB/RseB C-terminal domain-containing protein [Rhodoferax sp.]
MKLPAWRFLMAPANWACVLAVVYSGVSLTHATPQQAQAAPASAEAKGSERSISEWLMRMHEASRKRAYVGTFVVTSASSMSSARIWHACDGDLQMDRVESLTGAPRSTFRRNDDVITFHPESKTALAEKRDALGLFPNLLKAADSAIEQYYTARQLGLDRVAGFETDVVQLSAKDSLRYGYRVWSERRSGLVVKLQTLDTDGKVLEQAAYSELQLDAPVSMDKLSQMMANVDGYKVERPEMVKTSALAEGWALKAAVAGFKPMSCYKRAVARGDGKADGAGADSAMQWIFSDGLASVSLFAEVFDRQRHGQEGLMVFGATKSITRKLLDGPTQWWLTVVGEVPTQTLSSFAQGLERRK